jgi:hypothetical protein
MNKNTNIGLKGRVKVSVIGADGKTVLERPWCRNLLLDQGLNNLETVVIADLFKYAAKGTGTTATKETVPGANSFTLVASTGVLTRTAGTRDFSADDVGKLIRQADSPFTEGIVTTFNSATEVILRAVGQTSLANYTAKDILIYAVDQVGLDAESGDRTNTYGAASGDNGYADTDEVRVYTRTFVFPAQAEDEEDIADTNTFSRSGTTVTRDAGTRDFTAADVGKYIYFDTATTLTKITALIGVTQVTVADSGTIATQTAKLYGFTSYGEIGFSNLSAAGDNLNIRVRLEDGGGASDPVVVEGENPETPGQQLKVVYELTATLSPAASTPLNWAISDTGNDMSANKNGDYAIENIALSTISTGGDTGTNFAGLEPATAGEVALSSSSAALVAFAGPYRGAGAVFVAMEAEGYTADSFTQLYSGVFGLNDAIATNWRSAGIYDSDSDLFALTFVFDAAQTKDADHTLTLRFSKTWNRDLS